MQTDSDHKITKKILQHVGTPARQQTLEVGCGAGRISALLAGKVGRLTAIDPDQASIVTAQQAIPGVDFQKGSGEQLAFPDTSFDLVIFTLSLHHQNSAKALDEAARVLKPAGTVLVVEPHVDGEVEQVFAFVHNENQAKLDAQQAISTSDLHLEHIEEFTAEWRFENENDLLTSMFAFYQLPFDHAVAGQMSDFIAEKLSDLPIILEDKMTLQVLTKR